MFVGKVLIVRLIAGQIKRISSHKMNYYPEPDIYNRSKIKVHLDLSSYVTKSEVKKHWCGYIRLCSKG